MLAATVFVLHLLGLQIVPQSPPRPSQTDPGSDDYRGLRHSGFMSNPIPKTWQRSRWPWRLADQGWLANRRQYAEWGALAGSRRAQRIPSTLPWHWVATHPTVQARHGFER
jgi:hypothetical protein